MMIFLDLLLLQQALGILSKNRNKKVVIKEFINGLRKSFSGKDYLRDINQCDKCGKPSFFSSCLLCETEEAFRGWDKK
tara:strand:- start:382 stop:615 length:234 start_codon:yes stop_codon:yes gene_type:complete